MAMAARSQVINPPTIFPTPVGIRPAAPGGVAPYYPSDIQAAYGLSTIQTGGNYTGAGQTIAIIDPYDYPNAASALNTFSTTYGLPLVNQGGSSPTFKQLDQNGGNNLPGTDPNPYPYNAEGEEALDIEWAHAMAPQANIILYEASSFQTIFTAVQTAAANPNVSVVSMSFGGPEAQNPGITGNDSIFTTPQTKLNNKVGVTFVASSGDSGAYVPNTSTISVNYPASSSNVVAVGGTSLTLSANSSYSNETAWGSGASTRIQRRRRRGHQRAGAETILANDRGTRKRPLHGNKPRCSRRLLLRR